MPKISTHLWFDKEAKAAADFYVSLFKDARITSSTSIDGTPSGSVDIVSIALPGQDFTLISAGPLFKFTPAISFLIACETPEEVDKLWGKLSVGGEALMELGSYPFSQRYGWTKDKYGLSWQIMHTGGRPITQKITPTLMFVGQVCGRAEEAITLYTSIFANSEIGHVMRYGAGEAPDKEGTIRHAGFSLLGQQFAAMDSAHKHEFSFNEAISLMVTCDTQAEIDHCFEKLSAVPAAEQCGWLKDAFGVSWQIVPTAMNEMMSKGTKEQVKRVTEAFMKMKKFDIATLQQAYEGA